MIHPNHDTSIHVPVHIEDIAHHFFPFARFAAGGNDSISDEWVEEQKTRLEAWVAKISDVVVMRLNPAEAAKQDEAAMHVKETPRL